ncbi:hypothetical protein SISSUDRAFT_1047428 [Sistotremastrum suecicum HHB10207 ss-3]|uniref:Auxin efflux carrier n=1 Tax=Sistotremastrum suecicum HHB10207 ss-3 TaxID=1314776 RepID=A0A166D6S6_9AGAM|nr:hypothetical protein SISSUDRAFT_1047428 [Sistotremastrum suecicum HHB10207 ss-3]
MATSLGVTLLSSFESSLSVLLTLSYGLLAAKLRILSPNTASQIARLCISVFLPALLFTSLGKQLGGSGSDFEKIWPLVVWSVSYPLIALALTYPFVRFCDFPTWSLPAAAFNNTTSLPLLLVQALASTGTLDPIVGSGSEQQYGLTRLRNYILVNAMVSNAMNFTIGPSLLKIGHKTVSVEDNRQPIAREDDAMGFISDERQPLLPRHKEPASNLIRKMFPRFSELLDTARSLLNPPLIAVICAIIVGEIPPLQRAFFAKRAEGGILNAWLTKSIENMGGLFTAIQMFVVGQKLYEGMTSSPSDHKVLQNSTDLPQNSHLTFTSSAWLVFLRFALMPLLSTTIVYFLLSRTTLLDPDPALWFALIIAATGPPAIRIAALLDLSGLGNGPQQAIARLLAGFYVITPLISFPVVAAIIVCQWFL